MSLFTLSRKVLLVSTVALTTASMLNFSACAIAQASQISSNQTAAELVSYPIKQEQSASDITDNAYTSIADMPLVRISVDTPLVKTTKKTSRSYVYEFSTLLNDQIHYYFAKKDNDKADRPLAQQKCSKTS